MREIRPKGIMLLIKDMHYGLGQMEFALQLVIVLIKRTYRTNQTARLCKNSWECSGLLLRKTSFKMLKIPSAARAQLRRCFQQLSHL